MKRLLFLLLLLLVGWTAFAQSPEEMYQEYMTPETRAIIERFDEAERVAQEARSAARGRKALALAGAILIGLIPLGAIGRRIIRAKTWKVNPSGTIKAVFAGIGGGFLLFALNYGVFLMKIRMGSAFNTALAFLIVGAMIAVSIYLLRGKSDS